MPFVYLLESSSGVTYIGATMDVEKRLRQHNGEICGGAHATTSRVTKGESWSRVCYIQGCPDWTTALQVEWRWKQLSRKLPSKMAPLERRLIALKQLLSLERPTTKALAYQEWQEPPSIYWDSALAEQGFLSL